MISALRRYFSDWLTCRRAVRALRRRARIATLYEMRNASLELMLDLTPNPASKYPFPVTNARALAVSTKLYGTAHFLNSNFADEVQWVVDCLARFNKVSSKRLHAEADALVICRLLRRHIAKIERKLDRLEGRES